jgi:hypothetical protein
LSGAVFFGKDAAGRIGFLFSETGVSKRLLIIYYSFTQQTRLLLKRFAAGLEETGIEVTLVRLEPVTPYSMPFRTNLSLLRAMVETFFCRRTPIKELPVACRGGWDRIVIAGPTWSYQPSGPVLSFLDHYAADCENIDVTPLISCRSYWRLNYRTVRKKLEKAGARVLEPIVYQHPTKEPYRVIGLLLQLRGKMVRRDKSWFRKHYPHYGHNQDQLQQAETRGREMGCQLLKQT